MSDDLSAGVSLGTAAMLGLAHAKMLETPTTAHFLFGSGCVNDCAFCAQARSSEAGPNHLSRVTWPQHHWAEVREPLTRAITDKTFKRICAQAVESPSGTSSVLTFIRAVRAVSPGMPVSACVSPFSVARVASIFEAGASDVGLPVDAVTTEIYERIKGGSFAKAWDVLTRAAERYPGRVTTHFIVGLGETEEEMVAALFRARAHGIRVGLFSFTPVKGAFMQDWPPPDVSHYRRVQLAAHCIAKGVGRKGIECANGRITKISVPPEAEDGVRKGLPFMTSGCSGCNRPYYNERPGQTMMNYPRELSDWEARECLSETNLTGILGSTMAEGGLECESPPADRRPS